MSAPVPRRSQAIWPVVIAVVVFQIPYPVVRVLSYSDDGTSDLLVISDHGREVLRNHDGVLLVSEKVDR